MVVERGGLEHWGKLRESEERRGKRRDGRALVELSNTRRQAAKLVQKLDLLVLLETDEAFLTSTLIQGRHEYSVDFKSLHTVQP